jgi:hypothetical protein
VTASPRVLALATLGAGSNEEARIRALLADLGPEIFPFDRARKSASARALYAKIRREQPDVVVMEGTGSAAGLALVAAKRLAGQKYVVSSGDAVGPWVAAQKRLAGPLFHRYERLLCKHAAGFIGWTPYLAGRAMTFGTPRAMTAAGWAPFTRTAAEQVTDREMTRTRLGIPATHLVVGIAGTMQWSHRHGYCYGAELVHAARRITRPDITFLLVGDGDGRAKLESLAAGLPAGRVIFTGRIPQAELPGYYAAMDLGSLPQSVDPVGAFRYTTKLSEYLAFRLPVLTSRIPMGYDLDTGWLWRLPGAAPWVPEYAAALAHVVGTLTADELARRRATVPQNLPEFDRAAQATRAAAFIREIAADSMR